jgi:hypothetical protein
LQTFKHTFHGNQAISWLVASGEAASMQEAIDLGNKLMRAGFIKGCSRQEAITNDSDVYRFVSAMSYSTDFMGYADPNYKSRPL